MPNIGDFLPQPPWKGPPIPRSALGRTLTWRMQESTLSNLSEILDRLGALRERLPRSTELIEPYTEDWEKKTFQSFILKLDQFRSDVAEVISAIGEIKERGINV